MSGASVSAVLFAKDLRTVASFYATALGMTVSGAIRLDFPVASIEKSRTAARELGGDIDVAPPAWADRDANFFFGCDPEGNQFGVREQT